VKQKKSRGINEKKNIKTSIPKKRFVWLPKKKHLEGFAIGFPAPRSSESLAHQHLGGKSVGWLVTVGTLEGLDLKEKSIDS